MESISQLAASVRANPGQPQEIRDGVGRPVFFALHPLVFDRYIRPHLGSMTAKAPKPRKSRPAGKQSYRQRHKRAQH